MRLDSVVSRKRFSIDIRLSNRVGPTVRFGRLLRRERRFGSKAVIPPQGQSRFATRQTRELNGGLEVATDQGTLIPILPHAFELINPCLAISRLSQPSGSDIPSSSASKAPRHMSSPMVTGGPFVKAFRGNEGVSTLRQLLRNLRGKVCRQCFRLDDANAHQRFAVAFGLLGTHGLGRKQIASALAAVDA